MTKQEVYELLERKGFETEIVEHPSVFTVQEVCALAIPHPEWGAKNLFLRDDKKRVWYLLTAADERRIDIKDFQKRFGTRRLSFASPGDLYDKLRLTPGSVSPFGLLNDDSKSVRFYLDEYFKDKRIGVHPLQNDATVFLKTEDLLSLIREHGNEINWF